MNKGTALFLGVLITLVFLSLPFQAEAECQQLTDAGVCISAQPEVQTAPGREGIDPLAWGTAGRIYQNIPAVAFAGWNSSTTYNTDGSGSKYRTGGSVWFDAPIHLPSGASVERLIIDMCDTSAMGNVWGWFFDCPTTTGTCDQYGGSGTLTSSGTPGCTYIEYNLPATVTINNLTRMYFVRVRLDAADDTTSFRDFDIGYRLQISPAPATATFSDVPTGHAFFPYIEALYDSGITTGCGVAPLRYCPDAPITRGQMAVFLSKALGLYWLY